MVLVEIESLYNRYVSSTVIEYAKPKRERERERESRDVFENNYEQVH